MNHFWKWTNAAGNEPRVLTLDGTIAEETWYEDEISPKMFREELNAIRERAARSSYEGIERILDSIQTAELRLRANVNFELVMELLFLTIRET